MDAAEIITALGAVITTLSGTIAYLFRRMMKAEKRAGTLLATMAYLEATIDRLNGIIEARGSVETATIIVQVQSGLIKDWSPGATVMFGWRADEAIGKPVTVLVPKKYRQKHLEAWDKYVAGSKIPKRGPLEAHAMTKSGRIIPVNISYSCWDEKNSIMVAAVIRNRIENPATDLADSQGEADASADS